MNEIELWEFIDTSAAEVVTHSGRIIAAMKDNTSNESYSSYRDLAKEALWLTVQENPDKSPQELKKLAKKTFARWIQKEYQDDLIASKPRKKQSAENFFTLPWGNKTICPIAKSSSEDTIEESENRDRVIEILDRVLLDWGPHAMCWLAIKLSQGDSVRELLIDMGVPEKELHTKKQQIERVLNRIIEYAERFQVS